MKEGEGHGHEAEGDDDDDDHADARDRRGQDRVLHDDLRDPMPEDPMDESDLLNKLHEVDWGQQKRRDERQPGLEDWQRSPKREQLGSRSELKEACSIEDVQRCGERDRA